MPEQSTEEIATGACIERVLPSEFDAEASLVAETENPANAPLASDGGGDGRIALLRAKKWLPGRTLRIRFLDGSKTMREKVVRYAEQWTKHANLKFDFGNHAAAHIRISFYADRGSWSALGTDALVRSYFPLHQPTMNFGWLRDNTSDDEYSRVVIHEFGHALGAIHEHQNPRGGLQWKKDAVYAYFSGPPNYWDRRTIDYNILDKYSLDQLQGTNYDPDSIMLYAFPGSLMEDGKGTKSNTTLSALDIALIKKAYP